MGSVSVQITPTIEGLTDSLRERDELALLGSFEGPMTGFGAHAMNDESVETRVVGMVTPVQLQHRNRELAAEPPGDDRSRRFTRDRPLDATHDVRAWLHDARDRRE